MPPVSLTTSSAAGTGHTGTAEPPPSRPGAPQAPGTAASNTELLFPLHLAQKSGTGRVTEVAAALCPASIQQRVLSPAPGRAFGDAHPSPCPGQGAFHKGLSGAPRLQDGASSPGAAGTDSRLSDSLPVNSAENCSSGKTKPAANGGSLGCRIIRSDGRGPAGHAATRWVPWPGWRHRPCPRPPPPPRHHHLEFSPADVREKNPGKKSEGRAGDERQRKD